MSKVKLCIDPGHGNSNRRAGVYDPGAQYGGVSEADVALQWALTLKWVLTQRGIPVFLTRDDDSDPTPVGTRDDKAEAAGCTHFLSLHCNMADGKASGSEVFYRDSVDKAWASTVLSCLIPSTQGRNRGIKSESDSQHTRLAVFDFDGPAALAEIEFIDGPNRSVLTSRLARVAFAERLADALEDM